LLNYLELTRFLGTL